MKQEQLELHRSRFLDILHHTAHSIDLSFEPTTILSIATHAVDDLIHQTHQLQKELAK